MTAFGIPNDLAERPIIRRIADVPVRARAKGMSRPDREHSKLSNDQSRAACVVELVEITPAISSAERELPHSGRRLAPVHVAHGAVPDVRVPAWHNLPEFRRTSGGATSGST